MTESFNVQSKLTVSSNLPEVIRQLIEGFENVDKLLKDSQEGINRFASAFRKLGSDDRGINKLIEGLDKLSSLKLGGTLLGDLAKASDLSRNIATAHNEMRNSATAVAKAWQDIAAASRQIRFPTPPSGGGGGVGGGGGRRRNGPNGPFNLGDDYANAVWMNQDYDARSSHQERQARESFNSAYAAASRENQDFDSVMRAQQRAADQKYRDDYALAQLENRDRDLRAKAAGRANERNAFLPHMTHHELGNAGIGLQMGGELGSSFFGRAVMSDFEVAHRMALITADTRVTPDQAKSVQDLATSMTRRVPGSTIASNLEVFTDLKNAFGDFNEAKEALEPFVRLVTTLQMADMSHGGAGDLHQALNMARFIEDQGGAIDLNDPTKYDQKKFTEIANKAVAISVATQGRVSPREMLAFQKMARSGGMMMSDHALYEETPFFAQGFGASKLGTAIFSDVQVMLAGRLDRKREQYLEDIGLLPKGAGHLVGKGRNAYMKYDPSLIKDRDLLMTDPYKWIHDVLGGVVAKRFHLDPHNPKDEKELLLKLTEAAQRSTIAGLWVDVFRSFGPAQKEGKNIAAINPDMLSHLAKNDPMAQLMIFHAAENEFMVTMGEFLKGPAIDGLHKLTDALHSINDWAKENPAAAELVKVAAGLALLSQALGGLVMFAFFAGPVARLFTDIGKSVIGFRAGGAAAEGLAGLSGLLGLLSRSAGPLAFLYMLLKPNTSIGSQHSEDTMMGKGNLNPDRFDHAGAGSKGPSPETEFHKYLNRVTGGAGWANSLGAYVDRLANPKSYYHDPTTHPDSLVGPNKSSLLYQGDKTSVVNVRIVNGKDLVSGVDTGLADLMNRPDKGIWGPDMSRSLNGAQYGR